MATVLIVDDHPNIVKSLYMGLKKEGFEVATAATGITALELAEAMDFDWIVTDLDMPQMDGVKLVKKIKEIQPEIKVVIVSSQSVPEGMSMFPVLQKPFLFEELLILLGLSEE